MPTPPWKKKAPAPAEAGRGKVTLTPESIAWAKAAAKNAGRRYPNLVDNMAAARRQREARLRDGAADGGAGPRHLRG